MVDARYSKKTVEARTIKCQITFTNNFNSASVAVTIWMIVWWKHDRSDSPVDAIVSIITCRHLRHRGYSSNYLLIQFCPFGCHLSNVCLCWANWNQTGKGGSSWKANIIRVCPAAAGRCWLNLSGMIKGATSFSRLKNRGHAKALDCRSSEWQLAGLLGHFNRPMGQNKHGSHDHWSKNCCLNGKREISYRCTLAQPIISPLDRYPFLGNQKNHNSQPIRWPFGVVPPEWVNNIDDD